MKNKPPFSLPRDGAVRSSPSGPAVGKPRNPVLVQQVLAQIINSSKLKQKGHAYNRRKNGSKARFIERRLGKLKQKGQSKLVLRQLKTNLLCPFCLF